MLETNGVVPFKILLVNTDPRVGNNFPEGATVT